ncbi:hypothetical protein HF521_009414 [Silurus meridionalis]|uniref:Uncharacterized protein n=1 Tax=Silurus meridionalis TaxID=175797 RepID=A0A8T0BTC8_SILME|nr:hypothetical protein HF521_009414 [Silurus meridionalis]
MAHTESGVVVNGTQVSYIGHDCELIPEFLAANYGSSAKRLDLSFNQLSFPDCGSYGGPVIPRMYAVDVSYPLRALSLSQGKPSSTSEEENPPQSLRGRISSTPLFSCFPASYWPLQS